MEITPVTFVGTEFLTILYGCRAVSGSPGIFFYFLGSGNFLSSQAKTDFTATYRLLEDCRLGEGAYASVFLAEHLKVSGRCYELHSTPAVC